MVIFVSSKPNIAIGRQRPGTCKHTKRCPTEWWLHLLSVTIPAVALGWSSSPNTSAVPLKWPTPGKPGLLTQRPEASNCMPGTMNPIRGISSPCFQYPFIVLYFHSTFSFWKLSNTMMNVLWEPMMRLHNAINGALARRTEHIILKHQKRKNNTGLIQDQTFREMLGFSWGKYTPLKDSKEHRWSVCVTVLNTLQIFINITWTWAGLSMTAEHSADKAALCDIYSWAKSGVSRMATLVVAVTYGKILKSHNGILPTSLAHIAEMTWQESGEQIHSSGAPACYEAEIISITLPTSSRIQITKSIGDIYHPNHHKWLP